MSRFETMMAFLHTHLAVGFQVQSLAGDASFRRYHRIVCDGADTQKSPMTYLLMDAPPDKESVVEFVAVAGILTQKVNVPQIIAQDIKQGFLLLQDFGLVEFAHVITKDEATSDTYYHKALATLVDLQQLPTDVSLPFYTSDKLHQEMALFTEWFLPYIKVDWTTNQFEIWQAFCEELVYQIERQPKVVVHRDYHSRNLMVDKDSDMLGVIDFQDAVIGAYTYDLVSLLRDAYISFDEAWVMEKLQYFHKMSGAETAFETLVEQVNVMGVQRHLKVLGIFIRLFLRDGKDRYLQNIPKVMKDLLVEVQWLAQHRSEPIYAQFYQLVNDTVVPAYQKVF